MEPLIRMEGITKDFPGVRALDNISFDIMPGEVHVLIGENGAGKSTLMKILSGVYTPTSGKIICNGHEYDKLSTRDSYDEGIAIVYQELSVIDELSIPENLFVGKLPTKKWMGIPVVDYALMREKAADVLEKVGLHHDPETMVGDLQIQDKQLTEIAKALVSGAKVIVLDEPTTSLTTSEVENLHNLIRAMKAVYCCNDGMAMGAMQAIINAGKVGEILLCGTDGDASAIEAVAAGNMTATVAQDSAGIGVKCLEMLVDACANPDNYTPSAAPEKTPIDGVLVTADNAADYVK